MRYKAIVMYDGTNFHGFQSQENLRTVQQEIEDVLKIVCKKETKIYPAGRTDTGVHAYGQVFHFDASKELPEKQWKRALNHFMPEDIHIIDTWIVEDVENEEIIFHYNIANAGNWILIAIVVSLLVCGTLFIVYFIKEKHKKLTKNTD